MLTRKKKMSPLVHFNAYIGENRKSFGFLVENPSNTGRVTVLETMIDELRGLSEICWNQESRQLISITG